MTMFHTRGWGEEDNRLVSRVDFKHTQLLARRRPVAAARAWRCSGLRRDVEAAPGHGQGRALFPKFSFSAIFTLRRPGSCSSLSLLWVGRAAKPHRIAATPLGSNSVPERRRLAPVAPEACELARRAVAASGSGCPDPGVRLAAPGLILAQLRRRGAVARRSSCGPATRCNKGVQRVLPVGKVRLTAPRALLLPRRTVMYLAPQSYHHHLFPARRAALSGASRPHPTGLLGPGTWTNPSTDFPRDASFCPHPVRGDNEIHTHTHTWEHAKRLGEGGDPHPAVSSRGLRAPPLCSPRSSPARLRRGRGQHRGTRGVRLQPQSPCAPGTGTVRCSICQNAKSFHTESFPETGGKMLRIPRSFPSLFPFPPFLPSGPFRRRERAWEFTLLGAKGNSFPPAGMTSRQDSASPGPQGSAARLTIARGGVGDGPATPVPGRGDRGGSGGQLVFSLRKTSQGGEEASRRCQA